MVRIRAYLGWASICLAFLGCSSEMERAKSIANVDTGLLSIDPPSSYRTVFEEIKTIDYEFKIRNNCGRDVKLLQVIPSCSCAAGSAKADLIPSQSDVAFHVSYDSGSQFGDLATRVITIKTDHPKYSLLRCEVGGYRKQRYRIEPATVDFGEHEMGHDSSAEIVIDASQEDGELAFDQANTAVPFLSTKLLSSEAIPSGTRHRLLLNISNTVPTGKVNTELFIPHIRNSQVGPRIAVRAEVRGPLRLVPQAAFLGVMTKQDDPRRVPIRLMMQSEMQVPGSWSAISEVSAEGLPRGVSVVVSKDDPAIVFLLADPQNMDCGVIEQSAVLCCRYKEKQCRINFEIRSMVLK